MTSLPFHYIEQGEWLKSLEYVFRDYLPFGLFWIMLGGLIFAIVQTKTKSFGISGMVIIAYSVVISPLLPPAVRPFVLLLITMLGGTLFVRIWLSRGV